MEAQMINSKAALEAFIDELPDCKDPDPNLYVDLEGNNLSRKGTLSLITILVEPRKSRTGTIGFHTKSTHRPSIRKDGLCTKPRAIADGTKRRLYWVFTVKAE